MALTQQERKALRAVVEELGRALIRTGTAFRRDSVHAIKDAEDAWQDLGDAVVELLDLSDNGAAEALEDEDL